MKRFYSITDQLLSLVLLGSLVAVIVLVFTANENVVAGRMSDNPLPFCPPFCER